MVKSCDGVVVKVAVKWQQKNKSGTAISSIKN
jgi:hypothetical protein